MKKCFNCNINVGGDNTTCPLCQNNLTGDNTLRNWPQMVKLKKQTLIYKLQLFLVLASVVIGLSLDFLLDLNNGTKHWSLIVTLACIVFEFVIVGFLKRSPIPAKIINISILHIAIVLVAASLYFDFFEPVMYIVIPIMMGSTGVLNFVLAFVDRRENSMVYLLANIFAGVVSYGVLSIIGKNKSIAWNICLMISLVTLIGIVVFRGRKVVSEVEKRMNI